jgi:hypothetical protein
MFIERRAFFLVELIATIIQDGARGALPQAACQRS